MFFVVGIPYTIGRAAYKAYKKHQAEKDARERRVPHTVGDPSHEISPDISYDSMTNASSLQRRPSSEFRREHHNSSSTSVASQSSSAAQAEVDLALEQDEEFRRFIQQQKQVYLSQHRSTRQCGGPSSVNATLPTELPTSQPPAYDDVIAGDISRAKSGFSPSSRNSQNQQVPLEPAEEIYLVSPTSVYSVSSPSEIDGREISPVTPTSASPRVVAELLGSTRPAVELPAVVV